MLILLIVVVGGTFLHSFEAQFLVSRELAENVPNNLPSLNCYNSGKRDQMLFSMMTTPSSCPSYSSHKTLGSQILLNEEKYFFTGHPYFPHFGVVVFLHLSGAQ